MLYNFLKPTKLDDFVPTSFPREKCSSRWSYPQWAKSSNCHRPMHAVYRIIFGLNWPMIYSMLVASIGKYCFWFLSVLSTFVSRPQCGFDEVQGKGMADDFMNRWSACGGVLSHGGTSIAGWFISVKILFKMNDLGVRYTPLLFWLNTHGLVSQTLGYGNRLKGSDI